MSGLSRYGHGSVVTLRSGLLGIEIGLPAPAGLIPLIPKYVICERGLWLRGSIGFCRVISHYGPGGLEEALNRAGLSLAYDGAYGASMPYARGFDVIEYVSPRTALETRVLSGRGELQHVLMRAVTALADKVGLSSLGLTGSYAMGIEREFSDVDLVVYGGDAAQAAYDLFTSAAVPVSCETEFGGFKLEGWPCVPWRRGLLSDVPTPVSWVGVPPSLASHCKAFTERGPSPSRLTSFKGVLTVSGSQPEGLLYPPCVRSEEGYVIVSYEYNAGGPLYQGGVLEVTGLLAATEDVIFLGSRELPGSLRLLKPYRS